MMGVPRAQVVMDVLSKPCTFRTSVSSSRLLAAMEREPVSRPVEAAEVSQVSATLVEVLDLANPCAICHEGVAPRKDPP